MSEEVRSDRGAKHPFKEHSAVGSTCVNKGILRSRLQPRIPALRMRVVNFF